MKEQVLKVMFFIIYLKINDYDEKNIEELLYYKYRNPAIWN